MRVDQVKRSLARDPTGSRLEAYLSTHLLLERAIGRRVLLGQITAVLGVPIWFCALLGWHGPLAHLAISGFAASAGALVFALAGEARCRRALRSTAAGVRAESSEVP